MGAWQPRLDILPGPQRRLWPRLGAIGDRFMLYGGTALALRLGHRESVDFDLFSDLPLRPDDLLRDGHVLSDARVERADRNTLVVMVDDVQLSFFGGLAFSVLDTPGRADNGLAIASLLDLGATKAKALLDRTEVKDYVDIDGVLRAGLALPDLLGGFELLFPGVSPMIVVRALGHLDDPRLAALPAPVKRRLDRAISGLRSVSPMLAQYPSIGEALRATR